MEVYISGLICKEFTRKNLRIQGWQALSCLLSWGRGCARGHQISLSELMLVSSIRKWWIRSKTDSFLAGHGYWLPLLPWRNLGLYYISLKLCTNEIGQEGTLERSFEQKNSFDELVRTSSQISCRIARFDIHGSYK